MQGLKVSPIYGIWNAASCIYDVSLPQMLCHLSVPMLSKDEFFNDLHMNHPGSVVLEHSPPPPPHFKNKKKNTHWERSLTTEAKGCLSRCCVQEVEEGAWRSEHDHATINLPLVQFKGSSLSCGCNNSYFHLHDCINYSITHVSRLQKCFPHREPCVRALTKGGNRTYTHLALH